MTNLQNEIKEKSVEGLVEPKKGGALKALGVIVVGAAAVFGTVVMFLKGKKAKNQPDEGEENVEIVIDEE